VRYNAHSVLVGWGASANPSGRETEVSLE